MLNIAFGMSSTGIAASEGRSLAGPSMSTRAGGRPRAVQREATSVRAMNVRVSCTLAGAIPRIWQRVRASRPKEDTRTS